MVEPVPEGSETVHARKVSFRDMVVGGATSPQAGHVIPDLDVEARRFGVNQGASRHGDSSVQATSLNAGRFEILKTVDADMTDQASSEVVRGPISATGTVHQGQLRIWDRDDEVLAEKGNRVPTDVVAIVNNGKSPIVRSKPKKSSKKQSVATLAKSGESSKAQDGEQVQKQIMPAMSTMDHLIAMSSVLDPKNHSAVQLVSKEVNMGREEEHCRAILAKSGESSKAQDGEQVQKQIMPAMLTKDHLIAMPSVLDPKNHSAVQLVSKEVHMGREEEHRRTVIPSVDYGSGRTACRLSKIKSAARSTPYGPGKSNSEPTENRNPNLPTSVVVSDWIQTLAQKLDAAGKGDANLLREVELQEDRVMATESNAVEDESGGGNGGLVSVG
ncbi:hypothetical protein V6N12_053322 [Hibiscus sabdariffa]|uniref:Uncharacterized protein n=1 Tax=Hibiscus sabdariffa TaxID=183260 RepID=A0ABR2DA16_9ROSI